ncbi:hypothetical protein G7046_g7674 [Stylonectria norvegica]|nr:hypothetical protein G7046_g7674 [Stylonectria norvegica]
MNQSSSIWAESNDFSPTSPTTQFSYFTNGAPSAHSTPATSPDSKHDHNSTDNHLPVLLQQFPKPSDEVDVKSMLERQPGRWSVHGQMQANHRRPRVVRNEQELREQRVRDFESAKRDLFAAHDRLRSQGTGPWQ